MRILFIGDIMGRSGREALEKYLPRLKKDLNVDVAIINGENAAHGRGITEKFCKDFYEYGADIITTGDHIWDQREILKYITRDPKLLRPANFPEQTTPGNGYYLHELAGGRKILVVNMLCRVFMPPQDDPFACMEEILSEYRLGLNCNAIFVDLHGEASSEKMAFGQHFSGRISAVIGTHTHIPTADAHIMNGRTAYMTDAGMSGDFDSVIGTRKETSIHRFIKKTPGEHFIPANENMMLCGALVVTNDNTGKALGIEPLRIGDILSETMPTI
ncbi:MAG: TIGR00282 family metallophosphoesterase [Alphaproteobacteria bacterium]|nr:MAG: TIGR00282 family metallophosphoesterase [Alphaproteobacteria bacterium]